MMILCGHFMQEFYTNCPFNHVWTHLSKELFSEYKPKLHFAI